MDNTRGRTTVKLWQLAAIAILVFGTTAVVAGSAAWYGKNKIERPRRRSRRTRRRSR